MAINNPNDSLKSELAAKTAAAPTQTAATPAVASSASAGATPMSTPATAVSNAATAAAPSTPAEATPSSPYDYQSRINTINDMYDSAINATRNNLDTTYEQNRRDLEANREQIAQTYQNQRNANAADYERARRNFNQQAMANGLNTGAGSQAALAQRAVYNKNQGTLGAAEASANAELDRSLADLKTQYQNNINAAIAENDYNRAATLLDEYNNQYSMMLNNAQLLSQYGDFSGYAGLFGQDTADQMRTMWMYQNPGIAYSMGQISADDYYKLTGSYPPGYGGGGGGGYYYPTTGDPNSPGSGDPNNPGITVDPTTGLEYINDGNGPVAIPPDEDGTGTPETPGNTRPTPEAITGRPNTFAGVRGGPNLDPDADPMAGRVGRSQDVRQSWSTLQTPATPAPTYDPGLARAANTGRRRADLDEISSYIQQVNQNTGLNLNPDLVLAGRLASTPDSGQAQPMALMDWARIQLPDATDAQRETYLMNLADMGNPIELQAQAAAQREANRQALRDRFFSSTFGNPVLAQNMADNQAQANEAAKWQGVTSAADLLARGGYASGVTPGAARIKSSGNFGNQVLAQNMADNRAQVRQAMQDLQRQQFEAGQRERDYSGDVSRIRGKAASGGSNANSNRPRNRDKALATNSDITQQYVDALNAQEQAKAAQYNRGNQQIYIPAKYQLIDGKIYHTTGHFTGNPEPGVSGGRFMPGYLRQDSNNWIMGPNFRFPMTSNVSR